MSLYQRFGLNAGLSWSYNWIFAQLTLPDMNPMRSAIGLPSGCLAVAAAILATACSPSSSPTQAIEAEEDRPPVFQSSAPRTTDHNREFSYTPVAVDLDGDPVTLSVSGRPSWMHFDEGTGTLSGVPGWSSRGTIGFSIRAEAAGRSAIQRVSLTVQAGDPDCSQQFGDPTASSYVLPYRIGETHSIIQSYCPQNPGWGHHKWLAYDFDTAMRDTVVASRGGVVLRVQQHNPDGTRECGVNRENFVNVLHDDGTVMRYVHLTKDGALVSEGENIAQGQPLGLSGDSGCSSGPHLHVTLHHDATHFGRQSTLPLNFSNADGPLNGQNGLMQATRYTALPF